MPIVFEGIQTKQRKAPWWLLALTLAVLLLLMLFTWSLFRAVAISLGGKSRLSIFLTAYQLAYIDGGAPYTRTQFPQGARNELHVFKLPGGYATGWYYMWFH